MSPDAILYRHIHIRIVEKRMVDNTVLVGKVIQRSAGTRSGMKRFRSQVNKKMIQANSHIAKTNMFNTPGGESFIVSGRIPEPADVLRVTGGVIGVVGIGMVVGFYTRL